VKGRPAAFFLDHTKDVMCLKVWRENQTFISGSCDKTAKLWDIRVGEKCVGNFEAHTADINACDWFPDGNAFITGSDDSTVRLFDIRAYCQLNCYETHFPQEVTVTSARMSSSGRYLFAGYDESPFMLCWSTLDSKINQDFASGGNVQHRISCLDMNCNGKALATGSWDYQLRIWS